MSTRELILGSLAILFLIVASTFIGLYVATKAHLRKDHKHHDDNDHHDGHHGGKDNVSGNKILLPPTVPC